MRASGHGSTLLPALVYDILPFFYVALRPRKRGGLLETGTGGKGTKE